MKTVAVLAMTGVMPFELAIPGQVFGNAGSAHGQPRYAIRICGPARWVNAADEFGACRIEVAYDMSALSEADTIIVPGHSDIQEHPPSLEVKDALRVAVDHGVRVASICTGAFILASAGLLDGQSATTHWRHAGTLAQRFPLTQVDPAVLFVDNGQVLTSAGVAAGMDMCMHLVHRDYGAAVAADTARNNVMPLFREGGQAQFIKHALPERDSTLAPTLQWLETNLHRPLSLPEIARHASVSVRTLNRRFNDQVGVSPLRWLLHARIERAQQLLETTDLPVDRIAEQSGFGAPETLRYQFAHLVGTAPQAYRNTFRARVAAD